MKLREFLAPERAIVPLSARSLQDAAAQLLERLVSARGVLDATKLRKRVAESAGDDVVAMGDRAFLLHHRTDAVGQLLVTLGVSREPICARIGDEGQERCARIVLLVVTPPRHAARYLQVVGAFARLLRKPDSLTAVHEAADAESLVELESFTGYALPEQLTVRDVMTDHPRTVHADTPLKEAARTIVRTGLGALPV
ncbi:MAG: CBS domain-containing protein, partial [Gemmatimonadaceae bacterium]